MKPLRILTLAALLWLSSSCAIIPTQHGRAQFWGDYTGLQFDDGSVHLRAAAANHSKAVQAHWHGVTSLGSEVVAGALGLHAGTQAVGAVATMIPPIVNRPTNRATPAPAK